MRSENKPRMRRLKRPMLLLLAVCFALVSLLSIGINAESRNIKQSDGRSEDYRKWAQGDSRWGSLPMGTSGKTVAQIGCLVTSVTKLIIQSGFRNSSSFNVANCVTWLNANGGLGSSGALVWAVCSQMVDGFDYAGPDYNTGSSSSPYLQNKILDYIRDGYSMVLQVNDGGHWVAVDNAKSLANGKVYIMDTLTNVSGNADLMLTSRYPSVDRIGLFTGSVPNVPDPNPSPSPSPSPSPNPNPPSAPAPEYSEQCATEPVSIQARVTAQSATLYTQPCASGNGSESAGTVSNGSTLDLSAQIVNTSGENWYRVVRENGQHCYISLQDVEFAGFVNDLCITPQNPPSGSLPHGSSYPLRETVTSSHRLTSITGRFVDRNGSVIVSVTLNPNTRGTFNVSSSQINSQLRFGDLPVGHYAYELIAEVTADSNMTSETTTFKTAFVSPFSIGTNPLSTHTVSFVDGITGETVATQTVAHGFYPVMISAPEHEGCVFTHWIGAGQRIYADTQITAHYSTGIVALGDADGNGIVSVSDALLLLRHAVGIINANDEILVSYADMNGDGVITISDAVAVLRYAMY